MLKYLPVWLFVVSIAVAAEKSPVAVSLICEVRSFAPGKPVTVGVSIRHDPGFHTYWHSPGTVGLPTMVKWELPEGYSVSELQWPYPERCLMEGYNTHGYNRDVVLLATLTPPPDAKPGPVAIKAAITYMACAKEKCCNLQYANEVLSLTCAEVAVPDPAGAAAIAAARKQLPQPYSGLTASFAKSRDWYQLEVSMPGGETLPAAESLYFYGHGQLVDSIRPQTVVRTPTGYRLSLPRTDYGPDNPEEMTGLLFTSDKWPGTDARHLPVKAVAATAK